MKGRSAGRALAGLSLAAAVVLLLSPSGRPPAGVMWEAAGRSAHVVLFAGLAWTVGRCMPGKWRGVPLWIGLALLAGIVEWVQPYVSRSGDGLDAGLGIAGAGVVCWTWTFHRKNVIRLAGILLLVLAPLLCTVGCLHSERQAFPVLLAPDSLWARRGWTLNAVRLAPNGEHGLRVEMNVLGKEDPSGIYPGLFRTPAHPDWTGGNDLTVQVYWPSASAAMLAVRVDDRPGNPPYHERFQQEFAVTPGWNSVQVPAGMLERTSGGRPMNLADIRKWGVFLVSGSPFGYFELGEVKLEPVQEGP